LAGYTRFVLPADFTHGQFAVCPGYLKVMTYNLEGMKPGTAPETRLIQMIGKIEALDPDIIGLQEINEFQNGSGNQGQRIADSLGAYFGVTYHFYQGFTHLAWNNQFREYVGIISKYPVLSQGFLSLVPGTFPRKVVWNLIDTPLGRINFFNTHLSFNSVNVRVQQVRQIIGFVVQQENANPGVASILTGDFNDPPNASSVLQLTNTGTDTFYWDTFARANPGQAGYTIPAGGPNKRIDYIFYKNSGQIAIHASSVVMNRPYDGFHFCSDHLGVLTQFTTAVTGLKEPEPAGIPRKMRLFQNYPNPFNPTTVIRYALPEAGFVSLKVFDILGRQVLTLVNAYRPAGFHSVKFDASRLSSGIYVYRLRAGALSKSRKMLLMK